MGRGKNGAALAVTGGETENEEAGSNTEPA